MACFVQLRRVGTAEPARWFLVRESGAQALSEEVGGLGCEGGRMKRAQVRFGQGFEVAISNARAQIATMTLVAGDTEGGPDNRHRGADQWLFVVRGRGAARINGRRVPLRPGTLLLIERGDRHEIIAGRGRLETLNVYVPPAYTSTGDERPAAKPR